ncbi:hypothetical protein CDD83_6984 [Cordyceps sp. RAO-2017]|nr:hypothetical protein CDD83_6984 [Cordyceps sp. RAO-2017]
MESVLRPERQKDESGGEEVEQPWALNIQQNHEEPVLKLFARLALSLSRTWATVQLEPDQMYHRERDTGTHKVMNDGVGQMSRRLASEIASCLGLTETPAGYQGRIGCAKGMWIVDVEDDGLDDDIWIETYPSQRKWACDWQDLEHRCFEVKTWSRQAKPAALNQQFIPLLEAQAISPGQMRETIAEHMRRNLAEELGGQSAALGNPEDLRLWVDRVGQSRTLMPLHRSIPLLGGLPATDEDLVGLLLDAGFDHLKLKILQGVLYDIGKKKADTLKAKTNVRIPQSTYLLMVADFTGTLEEGEVQVSFSTKYKVDGFCDTLLEEMDVLVARSPAHLPSDIQRVRAMSYPRLRKLKDVVIFSTKGRTPLADLLSGGDYDGDLAWVCWDRDIVNNFRNAPLLTAPDQISRNLFDRGYVKKLATKVGEILKEQRTVQAMCDKFVFSGFYFNMQQSHLGMITKYKEKLCYHRDSAGSDSAIQLSALLGLLVDQGKQGIIFSGKHWDKFRREVINGPPGLDDPEYFGERPTNTPTKHGRRHILDYLKFQVAEQAVNDNLTMFQSAISSRGGQEYDADLTKMYNDYELRAENSETCRQLLKCLRADIDAVKVMWQKVITKSDKEGESDYTTKVNEVYRKWMDIDPPEELQSSDLVQMLKEGWSRDPHSSPWALLKASATFRYHHKVQSFTWRMAGMQLCYLKSKMAAKTLPAAIVQLGMWACLRADKKSIMARSAQRRESMREGESFAALDLDERMEDDGYGYEIDDT